MQNGRETFNVLTWWCLGASWCERRADMFVLRIGLGVRPRRSRRHASKRMNSAGVDWLCFVDALLPHTTFFSSYKHHLCETLFQSICLKPPGAKLAANSFIYAIFRLIYIQFVSVPNRKKSYFFKMCITSLHARKPSDIKISPKWNYLLQLLSVTYSKKSNEK